MKVAWTGWTSRHSYSTASRMRRLPRLLHADLETFRCQAFDAQRSFQLPKSQFKSYPAIERWFKHAPVGRRILDIGYLEEHGATTVPIEITDQPSSTAEFVRVERPLSDFLELVDRQQEQEYDVSESSTPAIRIYLAQCPLSTLPQELRLDLPTPELVLRAGKGDVYDSSIWIGPAPTYTPLHKDPNPNLFVQLAGEKIVRIFEPQVGRELFSESQRGIGRSGSPSFRGAEMMQGQEKSRMEDIVWGAEGLVQQNPNLGFEANVCEGDAVFIPKGWWHSFKGVGGGIVGSVNWWFR